MTKYDLLQHLADREETTAGEIAKAFRLTYSAAAMALLRLSRQGLVRRYLEPDAGLYYCELSERGRARLSFLRARSTSEETRA